MNRTELITKGLIISSEAGFPVKLLNIIAAARLIKANRIPPINSHFHAIINTIRNPSVGILCIVKQMNFSVISPLPSKQSAENKAIKRIARIPIILGDQ